MASRREPLKKSDPLSKPKGPKPPATFPKPGPQGTSVGIGGAASPPLKQDLPKKDPPKPTTQQTNAGYAVQLYGLEKQLEEWKAKVIQSNRM